MVEHQEKFRCEESKTKCFNEGITILWSKEYSIVETFRGVTRVKMAKGWVHVNARTFTPYFTRFGNVV